MPPFRKLSSLGGKRAPKGEVVFGRTMGAWRCEAGDEVCGGGVSPTSPRMLPHTRAHPHTPPLQTKKWHCPPRLPLGRRAGVVLSSHQKKGGTVRQTVRTPQVCGLVSTPHPSRDSEGAADDNGACRASARDGLLGPSCFWYRLAFCAARRGGPRCQPKRQSEVTKAARTGPCPLSFLVIYHRRRRT